MIKTYDKNRLLDGLPLLISVIFGFVWAWTCGHRGFFGFDQSILFDGGYRVFQGQTPYVDFFIPTGPMSFWLQGIFFRLFGVNYSATVALAAILNAIGVLLSYRLLLTITSGHRSGAFLGSVLTAVWLFPLFGTPWFETIGHFFILLMLYLLVKAIHFACGAPSYADMRNTSIITFSAGVAAFCALSTKQTVGMEAILIAGLVWIAPPRRPGFRNLGAYPLGAFIFGIVSAAIVFCLWLVVFSDPGAFWHYTVDLPKAVGSSRLHTATIMYKMDRLLFHNPRLWPAHIITILVALIGLIRLFMRRFSGYHHALMARLAIALGLAAYLEMMITANHGAIAMPFVGLFWVFGVTFILFSRHNRARTGVARRRGWEKILMVVAGLFWLLAIGTGSRIGWSREVQDPLKDIPMRPALKIDKLSHIRWQVAGGDPRIVSENDFVQLVQWLRDNPKPFFVWVDHTILYGLCDVPSPQPILWFHRDLTYPRGGDEALESRILSDLAGNGVVRIIYETESWHGTEERLEDFPRLREMIRSQFTEIHRIGPFRILEKSVPLP